MEKKSIAEWVPTTSEGYLNRQGSQERQGKNRNNPLGELCVLAVRLIFPGIALLIKVTTD
jgi:hypothetical protein